MSKNKIYLGNSLEILKNIETESIDLTLTSPPYFNAREYSQYESYEENIESFKSRHTIPQSEFQSIYDDFCNANGITKTYKKSKQGMNNALGDKTVNGITSNCKWFGDGGEDEENDLPF